MHIQSILKPSFVLHVERPWQRIGENKLIHLFFVVYLYQTEFIRKTSLTKRSNQLFGPEG